MLKVICLFALAAVASAALARLAPQEKPAEFARQEGCYLSELDRVLPYDQPYYPEQKCEKYFCQKSNKETSWTTCGAVLVKPGCRKAGGDLTQRYPDCCPAEVCD